MDTLLRALLIVLALIVSCSSEDPVTTTEYPVSTTAATNANLAGIIIIAIIGGTVGIFILVLVTCFCCCRKKIRAAQAEAEELARARETARLISTSQEKDEPVPMLDPNRKRSTLKDVLQCLISPTKSAERTKKFKMIVDNRKQTKKINTPTPGRRKMPSTQGASENNVTVLPLNQQQSTAPVSQVDRDQQPSNCNRLSKEQEIIQIGQPATSECNSKEKHNPPERRLIIRHEGKPKPEGTIQRTSKDEKVMEASNDKMSKEKLSKEKLSKEKMSKEKPSKEKLSKEKPSKEKLSKEKTPKDKNALDTSNKKSIKSKTNEKKVSDTPNKKLSREKMSKETTPKDKPSKSKEKNVPEEPKETRSKQPQTSQEKAPEASNAKSSDSPSPLLKKSLSVDKTQSSASTLSTHTK